jgi:hypothetical protein
MARNGLENLVHRLKCFRFDEKPTFFVKDCGRTEEEVIVRYVQRLRDAQRDQGHPGHELGTFLLQHINSPEYLVGQLQAYLAVAQADLEVERGLGLALSLLPNNS